MFRYFFAFLFLCLFSLISNAQKQKFNDGWLFRVDTSNSLNESSVWQKTPVAVTLPHDWSIEQPFDKYSPSGNGGGALRGGLGIYTKDFVLDEADRNKNIFIQFDGVYMNSTVSINGHTLGTRPFGYISFEYNLTPFLKFNGEKNHLIVRVENKQSNSRWYSGSGIYRNVWLNKRGPVYVKYSGTYVTTPEITDDQATVKIVTSLEEVERLGNVILKTSVYDHENRLVQSASQPLKSGFENGDFTNSFQLLNPHLWSIENPYLYKIVSEVLQGEKQLHRYETTFGIRQFHFDKAKGFFLNNQSVKIIGVCMHHDLGALGAAINVSAMRRQLTLLKGMGVNGIRTSHNPPAPEWLDLCDEMGFIVMDEAFDVWKRPMDGSPFNYQLYFDDWYAKDLADQVLRDRNHPSVFMWSIGNEIPEQWGTGVDTSGRIIARNMTQIIKGLDTTRPITSALNYVSNDNNIYRSGALDIIGINYHHPQWKDLGTDLFQGDKPYILAENVSPLTTRGHYDMPTDSIRRWSGFTEENPGGNPDLTASAYENLSVPWGSTNEEAIKLFLKYPFLSGMYLWTGFDYLGEPTPYPFPARSSYFGIIDLAGFPKDSYYLYKSIFTKENVLHILPHWNWTAGQKIDVHVYFNNADEVELFLNNKSLGKKLKHGDDLFVRFNGLTYRPGTLKAVSRLKGKKVMESVVKTAGKPYQIIAEVDRDTIKADGEDLCFVKVSVTDKSGNLIPYAANLLNFDISGAGSIAALDNGLQTDLTPFSNKKNRHAFNGLALAMVRPSKSSGEIVLNISSDGLKGAEVRVIVK